jgi:hypothetical protein
VATNVGDREDAPLMQKERNPLLVDYDDLPSPLHEFVDRGDIDISIIG